MANPTFYKTGNTYGSPATPLQFASGRTIQSGNEFSPNQIKIRTGGNRVHVVDMGEDEQIIHANFLNVTPALYSQLVSFLKDNTVRWSGKTFTYTNENAAAFTVRYWGDVLADRPHANNNVDLDIPLRIEV